MNEGLEVIAAPATKTVTVNGVDYTFGPVTMGGLKAFNEHAQKVAFTISELLSAADKFDELTPVIAGEADDLISFVHQGTGIPIQQLRDQRPDDFIVTLVAVVMVNLDFFVRKLTPNPQAPAASANQADQAG